jgi:hypothetical protein
MGSYEHGNGYSGLNYQFRNVLANKAIVGFSRNSQLFGFFFSNGLSCPAPNA